MRVALRGAAAKTGLLGVPAALAILALCGLFAVGFVSGLTAMSGTLTVLAVVLAILVAGRFKRERRASAAIDFVASRLLSVESRLLALDRSTEINRPLDLEGVTSDITLLSGLVKSLAEAMAAQDREITELRGRLDRMALERAPVELPQRVTAPVPPRDPVRIPPADAGLADALSALDRPAPPRPAAGAANQVVPSLLPIMEERPAGRAPGQGDTLASDARRQAILEAIDAERIELHLQPIVSLPQRRTRLYEVLARLRLADDTLLAPSEFMPQLDRLGRLPQMDRSVVSRALAIAAHLATRESDVRLSCNLAPASLRDTEVLVAIEAMLELHGSLAARLVLEIPQRSWRSLPTEVSTQIDRLRALGVGFALDHATDLRFEGVTLGERGVTFIKLPAEMLLGAVRASDDPGPVAELTNLLARHGVHIVAERVERESQVPDLLDLDVALAQGFALGNPRAVRADFALARGPDQEPEAEPEAAPAAAEPAPTDKPLPFRAFLRRTA